MGLHRLDPVNGFFAAGRLDRKGQLGGEQRVVLGVGAHLEVAADPVDADNFTDQKLAGVGHVARATQ
jgi:hypothetical protein